jgi:hypothetical protein
MAIPCPWGHGKGHLGLLQDPVLYFQCNGAAFNILVAAPPEYPANAPATASACQQACATNLTKQKAWNTYIVVATITRNQFAAAIDNLYYAPLNDLTEGLNAIPLRDLVAHIQTTYATILQLDINNNMTKFNTASTQLFH